MAKAKDQNAPRPGAPYGYRADGTPRKRPPNSPETQAKVAAANRVRAARIRAEKARVEGGPVLMVGNAAAEANGNVGKPANELIAETLASIEAEIARLQRIAHALREA